MNSSGHKTSEPWLILLGVCLAASGLYAAQSSSATTTPKQPVAHSPASSTHPATHAIARKTGTSTTATHSATHASVTSHPGVTHTAARNASPHASLVSAAKGTPTHNTAYASQHQGSAAHSRHSANRRYRTLNSRQRLARLHLQPERAQEIQQALIREGYLQGDANGQWDARTHDAMLHYQTDHGFPPTGLPEAKSLMKLGLGSHPLPSELDHGPVGAASPGAGQGDLTVTPPSPPVSQVTPPS